MCANGIISTEFPFYLYVPQLFPGDHRLADRLIFAPFWVDVDSRTEGNIWYGSHHESDNNVTKRADELVHELYSEHSAFKSKVVYVATWEDVPNYPDGSPSYDDEYSGLRNTFQAALITDYFNTFLLYSYIDVQFSGRQSAVVGYTAGDGRQYFNQPGAQTDAINNVDQVKTGNYTGLLLFHLTSATVVAEMQCHEWYCEDKNRFGNTADWPFIFLPCPWTLSHAARDRRYRQVSSLSIKGECYIQQFPSFLFIGNNILLAETECCYHSQWLNVGSPFGGSASPYHRLSPFTDDKLFHSLLTVEPYDWCCLQSSNCHLYYERRPSIPSWFYWPPGWGIVVY